MIEKEKERKFNVVGVYLTDDEISYLDQLSDQLGVSRHALLQLAVRRFVERYRAGEAEIETIEKTIIKKETK